MSTEVSVPSRRDRDESSLRSRWLGRGLRELREDRGLTLKYVANVLGVQFADLAAHEHGRQVFVFDKVAALLDVYGIHDRVERDHLLGLARQVFRLPRWQDDFAGPDLDVSMLDYLWLESVAHRICCYGPVLMPPLLRTPEYVEAVIRCEVKDISDMQVGWWVQTYRDRQETVENGRVTDVRAVLAESVLRRPVGGAARTLPGQLGYLTKLRRSDRIQVRVLPDEASYVPWADGWFTLFELPEPYSRRVACAGHVRGVAIHEGAVAEVYAGMFDRLWDAATTQVESAALIGGLAIDLPIESNS
ncbi:helix-turn-helix domain-containing protein [Phytohabitans sp. LJ34]|uniref:helix-turn-helix domain-containing protein n=1 Tax=Phytohabitans sp. LJ34 TaxID=3452217 RepID=UPI003F88D928